MDLERLGVYSHIKPVADIGDASDAAKSREERQKQNLDLSRATQGSSYICSTAIGGGPFPGVSRQN